MKLAETLFGEHRRRLVISSLRRLVRELGDEGGDAAIARFLRHQAKTRNVSKLGAPIAAACDAEEFRKWRRRSSPPPEPEDDDAPTRVEQTKLLARGAAVLGEHLSAPRNRPAPRRSR